MLIMDPIADLCTRIRNATMRGHKSVNIPVSKTKKAITDVLKNEGFIEDWSIYESTPISQIVIKLKYDNEGDSIIRKIKRISKPGRRVHSKASEIKPILGGQGIAIVTTSDGILSDKDCRQKNVGGEILCQVW